MNTSIAGSGESVWTPLSLMLLIAAKGINEKLMCLLISLSPHVSRSSVDMASGNIFEFGSGRFLEYSFAGVKNVIFDY